MKCSNCNTEIDRTTGCCEKCPGSYNLEYIQHQSMLDEITSRNLEWTQNVEGCSFECLDKALELVARNGFGIYTILTSTVRGRILMLSAEKAGLLVGTSRFSGRAEDVTYRGIPGAWFTMWDMVSDFEVYIIGDKYPPTQESVAVLTLRRPVTREESAISEPPKSVFPSSTHGGPAAMPPRS